MIFFAYGMSLSRGARFYPSNIASNRFLGVFVDGLYFLLAIDSQDFAILLKECDDWQLLFAILPEAFLKSLHVVICASRCLSTRQDSGCQRLLIFASVVKDSSEFNNITHCFYPA